MRVWKDKAKARSTVQGKAEATESGEKKDRISHRRADKTMRGVGGGIVSTWRQLGHHDETKRPSIGFKTVEAMHCRNRRVGARRSRSGVVLSFIVGQDGPSSQPTQLPFAMLFPNPNPFSRGITFQCNPPTPRSCSLTDSWQKDEWSLTPRRSYSITLGMHSCGLFRG